MSLSFKAGLPASHVASFEHLSAKLGLKRIGQLGYVVSDVERACLNYGGHFGVRTWYRPNLLSCEIQSQGQPVDQRFTVAIGYWKRIQIEILQVEGTDRALFDANEASEEPRLHHIGFFVGAKKCTQERLIRKGYRVLESGTISFARHSKTHFAYLDTQASLGVIVELIENRFGNRRIDMPEWYVWLGALAGQVSRQRPEARSEIRQLLGECGLKVRSNADCAG